MTDKRINNMSAQNPLSMNLQNQQTSFSSSVRSYSAALIQQNPVKFPTKDQAIVFNTIDNSKLQDYLLQLGPIVNPKNILFSSRISNNRICVYLDSKESVDQFLNNHGSITINGEAIRARRLIAPSDRLVISNISPTIPHEVLVEELRNLGLTLISPVTFLRIGATNPEYSHILSFRRQVYITPAEDTIIPNSIELTHDDLTYRIFLSRDSQTCFECKMTGHIASKCPTKLSAQNQQPINHTIINECTASRNPPETSPDVQQISSATTETPDDHSNEGTTSTGKRNVSEILTPTSEDSPNFATPRDITTTKKIKHDQSSNILIDKESMQPIMDFLNQQTEPTVINSNQLKDFIENSHGTKDVLSISKDYTEDTPALIKLLLDVHSHIEGRALKMRCTKLRKKLQKQFESESYEPQSDSSDQLY